MDLTDRGNRAISVANGSELHGSIVTGTTGIGATQSVSINGSSIDNGGIYVAVLYELERGIWLARSRTIGTCAAASP